MALLSSPKRPNIREKRKKKNDHLATFLGNVLQYLIKALTYGCLLRIGLKHHLK